MKAVQKVIRNGNSWVISLPRVMMTMLDIRPGDFVQLEFHEGEPATLTRSDLSGDSAERSLGILPPNPPQVPR